MTLQALTGRLQELCHHGHAQDDVSFVLNGFVCVTYQVDVKPNPVCDGQVCFRVDSKEAPRFETRGEKKWN